MSGNRHKAREAAVQAIYQWQLTQGVPGDIEQQFSADHSMKDVDVDYFRDLVREVPVHCASLDDVLAPCLDRSLDQVDPVERAILRIGTYEFGHRREIPYRVILNEAVELAKTFGAEHGHRYVNAVLDKVANRLRPDEAPETAPGTPVANVPEVGESSH